MKNFYHRAWAEINLDVLKNNIEIIREYSGNRDIIAIVKANAYGHGDAECALAMNHIGVKHFAVSNLWEAQNLSSAGVEGDILLFGYCDIPLIFENLDKNYIFTVGSVPYARELSEAAVKAGLKVPVHIKFDTGMCRVGITTAEEADQILALPGLDCRAGYTHFSVADSLEKEDVEFTEKQYKKLADICHARKLPMHSQNSGGILFHKDFDGDFIRAGIVMYGHRPNTEYPLPDGIKSVFSMKAVISQIKTIKPGDTVMVIGGGTIGMMMLQLARLCGAVRVVMLEPNEKRFDLARKLGAEVPQEVIEFLAENINANVREIEGALSSLVANASFLGKKITITLAKEILKVYVQFNRREITIDHIKKVVCEHMGLDTETFNSPKRTREIAQARQIAMYLSKQHTKAPLTAIGAAIGGKNHATVLHACKAISNLMETDKLFRYQVEEIEKKVLAR